MSKTEQISTGARIPGGRILALLFLYCLPFPTVANGEWVLAGGKNDGSYKIYIRSDVRRLSTGLAEAWEVWNYREPQADAALKITYRSRMWLQSFNCNQRSAAVLSLAFYSEGMGKGTKLHSMIRSPDKIKYIRPAAGSPGEFMVNKVCGSAK